MTRATRPAALLAAAVLLAAGCASDTSGDADPVDLGGASGDPDAPGDTADDGEGAAADDRAGGDDAAADDAAAAPLADLSAAVPGTWPVGDAGTVTFSFVDGRLRLDDVAPADGWQVRVDVDDDDELEVDLVRDDVTWEFEAELEDGGSLLEVEIRQDVRNAAPGSYDLGDAGTFRFEAADGRLTLDALDLADGWEVVDRDEDEDGFSFEVRQGDRRFEVEVEFDDRRIEVEIDYRVRGPVTG